MRTLALILCLVPSFAGAGQPMTADEFDAYSVGKTLTYANGGDVYGVEQYLSGRRVRWAFVDDSCRIGHWYPKGQEICFVYEDRDDPQCWTFELNDGRLTARFAADPGSAELTEVQQTDEPLACTGPDVGV